MTLYAHFRSKDDLVAAYLEDNDLRWRAFLEEELSGHEDSRERLLAVCDAYREYFTAREMRGCAFVNCARSSLPRSSGATVIGGIRPGYESGSGTSPPRPVRRTLRRWPSVCSLCWRAPTSARAGGRQGSPRSFPGVLRRLVEAAVRDRPRGRRTTRRWMGDLAASGKRRYVVLAFASRCYSGVGFGRKVGLDTRRL